MKQYKITKKFNMQRFASMQDSLNFTTSEGMKADQKDYYDGELLRHTTPNLVYHQFAKKVGLPTGNGKTVRWRRLKQYKAATTPLQEGITPAGKKPEWEDLTATIEQYGDYTAITDRIITESMDPQVLELSREHGNQQALTIDTVTRDLIMSDDDVVNVFFPKKEDGTEVLSRDALDLTCGLTPNLISMVKTVLKKNSAKTFGTDYICIIHPDLEHEVTTHDDFVNVKEYGNPEAIYKGEIGELYGVRFVTTPQGKVWKDDTCPEINGERAAVYGALFIGQDAYGAVQIDSNSSSMIIKQVGSSGAEDPLNQRGTVGWKNKGYTAKVLNGLHMVRAEVCSKDFSLVTEAN